MQNLPVIGKKLRISEGQKIKFEIEKETEGIHLADPSQS